MQWTLEVVQVPVADVDRAKEFYAQRLGFAVDFDVRADEAHRFVQLTPPGSGCSIQLSAGYGHDMPAGSLRGLVLVVPDIRAAHARLVEQGVENGGVVVTQDGQSFRPARDDDALDNVGFVHFADPDGNRWSVQQISSRAPAGHDLSVTRVLDVPPTEAWRAWTEPEFVMRWWGPTGFTAPRAELDVREGGTSLVTMRAPAEYGGQDFHNTWTYRRVVPAERLEFELDFTDTDRSLLPAESLPPGVPRAVRHVVTLRPVEGERTELTVQEFGYGTAEARDVSRAGLEQCLDKMVAMFRNQ
ncbi:SRPBCC domain-containing protein [Pseudonocardia zijingensis]|uniref:VOC domain-containing protein n=1 Tax=Pseudonocardia zijingensis TaxID=153376 RepID=A0ABN1NFY6_9PSEU